MTEPKADNPMKVSLVVASGVHQGKVIPIIGPQFLIGRDPQCHLRPASQAVSKQHCAVLVRDGKVYLKDFGSTNGTVLNDGIVKGEERQLANNDSVKIGPLDFTIRIEATVPVADATPFPEANPEGAAALAAVKAATAAAGSKAPPVKSPTPAPGTKPGSKEAPALKTGSKETPALNRTPAPDEDEHDRLAAMLLGLEDGDVPGGSTVVDMPTPDMSGAAAGAPGGEQPKPDDKAAAAKKPTPSREDTSNAASEILRKYMRRPR